MSQPFPSPLTGYESAAPLPTTKNPDGKSYFNPPTGILSPSYTQFVPPIDNGQRGGFDVHVYFFPSQSAYAHQLWARIRHEFPELRIYSVFDRPIGPHAMAMFEVNLFTPAQFGAFIPWLAVWRGPLSVLVHPNTVEEGMSEGEKELKNHTEQAMWLGERVPVDTSLFKRLGEIRAARAEAAAAKEEEGMTTTATTATTATIPGPTA